MSVKASFIQLWNCSLIKWAPIDAIAEVACRANKFHFIKFEEVYFLLLLSWTAGGRIIVSSDGIWDALKRTLVWPTVYFFLLTDYLVLNPRGPFRRKLYKWKDFEMTQRALTIVLPAWL